MSTEHSVLALGAGKASAMHANIYTDLAWQVSVYDANPDRLAPPTMQEDFREQYDAGRIAVVHSLRQVKDMPGIIDVATSSGAHTDALQEAVGAVGVPQAILLEKPLDNFGGLTGLFENGDLDERSVFVNENYNASAALAQVLGLVEREKNNNNPVNKVYVSFDKNRVPDVLAGRFTDKMLGAYGIEVPHMVAVGLSLAGVKPADELVQKQNRYGLDVDGVQHSEYTYTHLETPSGAELIIAQGLGPFRMDEDGERHEYNFAKGEAIRGASVTFQDGRQAIISFAPVPELPAFHSKVDWQDTNGDWQSKVHEDNTLKRVIRHTIQYALTGVRPDFTEGLSIASGIQYAEQLQRLRDCAQVVIG